MLGNLGVGEILVLLVLALFVFGPQRLPHAAARTLRQVGRVANKARRDLRDGLGPEYQHLDIADLHPRTFVRKHLLDDLDAFDEQGRADRLGPARATATDGKAEPPPYDTDAT